MINKSAMILVACIATIANASPVDRPITLEEGVRAALNHNPELKQTRAQVEEARLRERAILTQYLPRLDTQFARNYADTRTHVEAIDDFASQKGWQNQLSLSLIQNLDLQGQVYRQHERARLARESLEANLSFQESALIEQVVEVYFTLLDSKRSLAGLLTKQQRNRSNRQLIEAEVRLGRRSQTDLGEITYAEAQDTIAILNAEQAIRSARKKLSILLMGDSSNLPDVDMQSAEKNPAFAQDWEAQVATIDPNLVLRVRDDITALQKKIVATTSERSETYWSFAPDLDLKADYNRDFSRYASETEPRAPDTTVTVGLVATWNLFAGGKDYLKTRENALAQYRDEIEYEHTLEKGFVELTDTKDQLQTQQRLVDASQTLLTTAQEKYESIKAQYELGRKPTSELLEAQVDLTDAEIGYDQERYRFYKQYAKLLHLAGRLSDKFRKSDP